MQQIAPRPVFEETRCRWAGYAGSRASQAKAFAWKAAFRILVPRNRIFARAAPWDPVVSELLVLCYHAISPTWSAGLSVTPEAFERQISSFARTGWGSANFSDAVRGRARRQDAS